MNRQRALPKVSGSMGVSKQLPCPDCKKMVTVGGPYLGEWIILVHSPNDDPTMRCTATEQKIKASPT